MILSKKFYIHLYIFFSIIIIIFAEFSTNFVKAENFRITNVDIKEEYNLNFNKSKAIDKAFKKAFKILVFQILQNEDKKILKDININQIKSFVDSFSIREEAFIENNYQSKINVDFNKKELINFLNSKGIITSSINPIDVIILPILIDLKKNQIFTYTKNPFFLNWNFNPEKYHQINYILPNEDIEDFSIIKKNIKDIEKHNFDEIFQKYSINNKILVVLIKQDDQLRVFSKLKFEKEEMYINKYFSVSNFNDLKEVTSIILELKNNFENKWKSINIINTSIVLPIKLSINTNDFVLTNQVESTLKDIDLISNYEIVRLNNLEIIYKIIFNGTPDKFLKIMSSKKLNIDTSGEIWKLQ